LLAEPESLPALQVLDITRRTFLERLLIHSVSLERLFMTNATHVGGFFLCPRLLVLHAQGSELIGSLLLAEELAEPNPLALSQRVELADKPEELRPDTSGSGSRLAGFLRQNSSSSKLSFNKLPSADGYLRVHAPKLSEARLDNSSFASLEVRSSSLQVLSLFRCPLLVSQCFCFCSLFVISHVCD